MVKNLRPKWRWLAAAAGGVAAVALVALFASLWRDAESANESLEEQLAVARNENAEFSAEISRLESDLARVQDELDQSEAQLALAQGQLTATQSDLTATQSQLTSVQGEVAAARQELSTAQADLATVRADAERCSTAGQAYVDALNAFVEVLQRYDAGQATLAELQAAGDVGEAAYDAFIANCAIQNSP